MHKTRSRPTPATFLRWWSILRLCTQASLLSHVFASPIAYLFTSLHLTNSILHALPLRGQHTIAPQTRNCNPSSDHLKSTQRRWPMLIRGNHPNTQQTSSNCFAPFSNTSSRDSVLFGASDAARGGALKAGAEHTHTIHNTTVAHLCRSNIDHREAHFKADNQLRRHQYKK